MITLGRLIYKATGVMSKKGIVKNCEKIGKTLAGEIKTNGGNVEVKRVSELLEQTIGKKKSAKITIAEDLDTFKAFAREHLSLSDEVAETHFRYSKSAVIPGKNGKVLLSLRLKNMNEAQALNTTSHELEHVFYNTVSSDNAMILAIRKCIPENILNNIQKRHSSFINDTILDFQCALIEKSNLGSASSRLQDFTEHKAGIEGLLKQTGFKTREQLQDSIRTVIRQDIILPHNNGINLDLLKILRKGIQDEARAYKVGGRVLGHFTPNENISKSEMLGQLYDEAAIVLKGEIKNQRKNRWRKLFGKPQIDYHVPKPTILESSEEFKPFSVLKVASEDVPPQIKTALNKKAPDFN